jgi:hypothetical protein
LRKPAPPPKGTVDVQYTTLVANDTLGQLYLDTHRTDVSSSLKNRGDLHLNVTAEDSGSGGSEAFKFFKYKIETGEFSDGDHSTTSLSE